MKSWHIKSHNILLSADGANANSLQFNGIWIKFTEEGKSIGTETHQCRYIDTVTAAGQPGKIRSGVITRSDGKIVKVLGKMQIYNSSTKHGDLLNLNSVKGLFPQGVQNFNNLIYNIKSYNKAHFDDRGNYYDDRKSYGKKFLDSALTLGSTGPLLGGTLESASAGISILSRMGLAVDGAGLFVDVSFSNLYEQLVAKATKKPVIIVDFDKENDSLRDSAGHVIRAFKRNIIEKRNEVITDENILQAMYHSVSAYLTGYMKRANSMQ